MRPQADQGPWIEWTQRDDRSLLDALYQKNWAAPYCLKSLQEFLYTIVTSLEFSSHSGFGVQPSKARLISLQNDFLNWMTVNGEWHKLHSLWKSRTLKHYSLPLQLSRSFLRFRSEHRQKNGERREKPRDVSMSSALLGKMNREIESMDALTTRLIINFCFDGLLSTEIAILLRTPLSLVETILGDAKTALKNKLSRVKAEDL